MDLPLQIRDRFKEPHWWLETNPSKGPHYTAYTSLLNYLFPAADYTVEPYLQGPALAGGGAASVFHVKAWGLPVFLVVVMAEGKLPNRFERERADDLMRNTFRLLVDDLTIPVLFGICAFGKQFAVYSLDCMSNSLSPARPVQRGEALSDLPPVSWWEYNLRDEEGWKMIVGLTDRAKDEVV